MLPSVDILNKNLLALSPTSDKASGIKAFVAVVANFMNQIQAGPGGSTGILTFQNSAMESILMNQSPVGDSSWTSNFANAWEAGMNAAIVIPGTVTSPIWIGSGVDVLTLPSASSTIVSVSAGKQILLSNLQNVNANNAAMPLAIAINEAATSLKFLCIGLGSPPVLPPISTIFNAQ